MVISDGKDVRNVVVICNSFGQPPVLHCVGSSFSYVDLHGLYFLFRTSFRWSWHPILILDYLFKLFCYVFENPFYISCCLIIRVLCNREVVECVWEEKINLTETAVFSCPMFSFPLTFLQITWFRPGVKEVVGDSGGRLTSLDASFMGCFVFFKHRQKHWGQCFFKKSLKHRTVEQKVRCFTRCF